MESLPSRERGLKSKEEYEELIECKVAPFAGARIEILLRQQNQLLQAVAPFAGARIEIRRH